VRLYVLRTQGTDYKYSARWLATDNSSFLFRSQLLDNVFWTVVSAVPIWTAYEVITLWAQANGFIPVLRWQAHPLYSVMLMFFIIPLFHEVHFYAIHRLIHWLPLYRAVHSLHHKNVNPGPWSGLAMHPAEHLLYFSGVLLCWIIPSHPLHVLFYLQYVAFAPAPSHSGFDKLVLNDRVTLNLDYYDHYLHHKYFEVNYGGPLVPIDKWLGTWHDGSEEAQQVMMSRLRERRRRSS
jgi:sterol desaturase/sphingolipid hydroxylase (fatty acid hydroxylase superfamily)